MVDRDILQMQRPVCPRAERIWVHYGGLREREARVKMSKSLQAFIKKLTVCV